MPAPTTSELTARIVEWDHRSGYGFLQLGKERVFLHHRDFAGFHRAPAVGDKISFSMGRDARGRSCAKNAVHANGGVGIEVVSSHANGGGGIGVVSILVLIGLLVLPVIAGQQFGADSQWVGAYGVLLSALTYWAYAVDKRRAEEREWRVSEARLHLLELLGGWPGAFLAQRRLRHKCSKGSYQVVFWLIVLAYQFAAFDSLQEWRLSRAALGRLERTSQHP